MNWRGTLETLTVTLAAIGVSLVLFAAFILLTKGVWPLDLYKSIYEGGFGTTTSWENGLKLAAPLMLTALCTALPARLGIINIGGEGSLILGGLAAALVALVVANTPFPMPQLAMMLASMLVGGLLIGLVGALSHWRGVNATICSLLVYYISLGAFKYLVEGPFRDPASLNKPSTHPIPETAYLGNIGFLNSQFEIEVHWGLAFGIFACLFAYILMDHSTFGFAARMTGGNVRAAQTAGLPVGRLILVTCFLGGAAAGLAGGVQIAAAEHQANSALYAQKFGFTGILIAFIARHHPLAIIPTAILFGGLKTASDTLQSRFELPDASMDVLAGTAVVMILAFETLYARFRVFQVRAAKEGTPRPDQPVASGPTPQISNVPA
jgi:general nucleoside transport system permease protein